MVAGPAGAGGAMTIEYERLGQFWRKKGKQIEKPLGPHWSNDASSKYRLSKAPHLPFTQFLIIFSVILGNLDESKEKQNTWLSRNLFTTLD